MSISPYIARMRAHMGNDLLLLPSASAGLRRAICEGACVIVAADG